MIPVNEPIIFSESKKNLLNCIKTNWISSNGKYIFEFEKKFAKYNSRRYGCSVSNGTAALEIAIKSLNLKEKSEVIIPAFSIISTANCIIKNNLKPILVDCDLNTWNSSSEQIIEKISNKTSAILITHIYGLPVNFKNLLNYAKRKNIKIIEDAAEVIGLDYLKKKCGSFGDVSVFSFYANKHITTGEGGMILTNDKKIYEKCNSLKNLSFDKSNFRRFFHNDIGWNYRMTNMQAAIGCGQLKNINKIVKRKREIGNLYYNYLKNSDKIILQTNKTSYSSNIYWVFGLVLNNKVKISRNDVMKKLLKKKIETRTFFVPMHQQPIYKKKGFFKSNKKYKISEFISKNGFYLPSGLALKNKEVEYVSKSLLEILG